MKILLISDLHYEKDKGRFRYPGRDQGNSLEWLLGIIRHSGAEQLVGFGDLGNSWSMQDWQRLTRQVKVTAIYGNHDNVYILQRAKNADGSAVLATDGEIRQIGGFKFGFINGIISARRTEKDNVPRKTPEAFLLAAKRLRAIDFLCIHESPILELYGTRFYRTDGSAVAEQVAKEVAPSFLLSGHLSFGPYTIYPINGSNSTLNIKVESSQLHMGYAVLDVAARQIGVYVDTKLCYTVNIPDVKKEMATVINQAVLFAKSNPQFASLLKGEMRTNTENKLRVPK